MERSLSNPHPRNTLWGTMVIQLNWAEAEVVLLVESCGYADIDDLRNGAQATYATGPSRVGYR